MEVTMSYFAQVSKQEGSDDLYRRRPAERKRVNIHEPYDVMYWAARFDCSPGQLVHAVRAVGVNPVDVLVYLERK